MAIRFTVIGTLQNVGHGDNMNQNLRSFVPFHAMQNYFRPLNAGIATERISFINYQPTSRALHEAAKQEVHKIIARNHGFDPNNPDSFDEWDTIKTVDQIGKIFDAMNMFLGSVGLVTLALGAIGIINIMLVAVADRTREIGLRKADRRDQQQHHVSILRGRSISDFAERRHRHCRGSGADGGAVRRDLGGRDSIRQNWSHPRQLWR